MPNFTYDELHELLKCEVSDEIKVKLNRLLSKFMPKESDDAKRERRRLTQNACCNKYLTDKYKNDPEYREKIRLRDMARTERLRNDPEFREQTNARNRARAQQKRATKAAAVLEHV